ncbi:MAG: Crp/Fnr family transcriptional regulator [Bacteroidota bacterium]
MTQAPMVNYLKSFGILTDEEIESFLKVATSKSIRRDEYFIKEGKICKEVMFVLSGVLRSFYYSSDGKETTYCFTFQNSFLTAYSSFIAQTPTQENIQAITDTEMVSVPKEKIIALEKSSTNWLRLFKYLAEQEYIKMEKRIFLLQQEPAEKRYEDLLENHPDYLHAIPLNYLASYLGISQRHLSRIRRSMLN